MEGKHEILNFIRDQPLDAAEELKEKKIELLEITTTLPVAQDLSLLMDKIIVYS